MVNYIPCNILACIPHTKQGSPVTAQFLTALIIFAQPLFNSGGKALELETTEGLPKRCVTLFRVRRLTQRRWVHTSQSQGLHHSCKWLSSCSGVLWKEKNKLCWPLQDLWRETAMKTASCGIRGLKHCSLRFPGSIHRAWCIMPQVRWVTESACCIYANHEQIKSVGHG